MTKSLGSAAGLAKRPAAASGRFDHISITMHWLTVLLMISQFTSAWLHEAVGHDAEGIGGQGRDANASPHPVRRRDLRDADGPAIATPCAVPFRALTARGADGVLTSRKVSFPIPPAAASEPAAAAARSS